MSAAPGRAEQARAAARTPQALSSEPAPVVATPYLCVDLDAFDRNAARMAECIVARGGKRWRPHVKAIRAPQLARRLLAAGACGVTVATIDEAQSMVAAGIDDVLLANQLVEPHKLAQVAALNAQAQVAIVVDDEAHLAPAAAAARVAGARIPVLVEVDVGLRRAGVATAAQAAQLARLVGGHAELAFCGVMAWEGHASRIAERTARAAEIRAALARLAAAADACAAAGMPCARVSAGGTATYDVASTCAGITEIQAGGGAFGDRRCSEQFGHPHDPALSVVASVLSRPAPDRAVCDAGFKALGTTPVAAALSGHDVRDIAWAAEHATVTLAAPSASPRIGERVRFAVGYSDSTVFLHERLIALRDAAVVAIWPLRRAPSLQHEFA